MPAAAQRGRTLTEAARSPTPAQPSDGRRGLDGGQRQEVLDTLIAVLGGAYAHLPAKRAAYAVDPVQALILLRRRAADLTDAEFHLAVTGHRDRPARRAHPLHRADRQLRAGRGAALPGRAVRTGRRPAVPGHQDRAELARHRPPTFAPGVELEWWNGMPFARAVEVYADRETGGRPDSRRARALETLTFRALDYGPPPDEHWVDPRLPDRRAARKRELRLPWRVLEPGKAATAVRAGVARRAQGRPPTPPPRRSAGPRSCCSHRTLWAGDDDPAALAGTGRGRRDTPVGQWLDTPMQDVLAAQALSRSIGYLRIWSFDVDDDDAFVDEVTRLLGLLPQTGLIVDLRGNPGGLVWAAERMLQLFTDATDRADPVLPRRVAADPRRWPTARSTGSSCEALEPVAGGRRRDRASCTRSRSPLTDPSWCNDLGRHYPGPVVAVVDANTYSSGDLFAAGWVDHDIGPLVSVGQATGAGGANVWTSSPAARRADRHRPRVRSAARRGRLHHRDPPRHPFGALRRRPDRGPRHRGHALRDDP